jgi:hypothetical protein
MVVDTGKTRAAQRVRERDVVHPSNTGGPLPGHELAAAAIAGWRRWEPALEEWARASRGARDAVEAPGGGSRAWSPRVGDKAPPAASVGTG